MGSSSQILWKWMLTLAHEIHMFSKAYHVQLSYLLSSKALTVLDICLYSIIGTKLVPPVLLAITLDLFLSSAPLPQLARGC